MLMLDRRLFVLGALSLLLLAALPDARADQIDELLRHHMVTEDGDRIVIEHTLKCVSGSMAPVFIRRYFEAPIGLVSRDVAVFLSTKMLLKHQAYVSQVLDSGADPLQTLSRTPCVLSLETEEPDVEIRAIAGRDGVSVETVDMKSKSSAVDDFTWSQLFDIDGLAE